MGNLTDDMTRLRGEVDALRGARGVLMNALISGARDLTKTVSAMRTDFTSTHATMAKRTHGERETFVAAVIDDVNSLLGEFSRDRNDMARKGRHDRRTFLSEMSKQVAGMCKETANDLIGARLAWRGESPGKSRPVPVKKAPVVKLPKLKTSAPVVVSMPLPKIKEKSRLDKKPAKAGAKRKQGRK